MAFQLWTILYILIMVPTAILLSKIIKTSSEEASKKSRKLYSLFLISVLVWTGLDFLMINLPSDQILLAGILNRLSFIITSIVVFFFAMSTFYFSSTPPMLEILFLI